MIKLKKTEFDVIIVGAGVAGLVCANYLAGFKLKTLLVEKENKAGGYCTSFRRNGFSFDSCVHSLGSCRKTGALSRILNELDIKQNNMFIDCDPSDLVIINGEEYYIHRDINKTFNDFKSKFPKERKPLEVLSSLINNVNNVALYADVKKCRSYSELLDLLFENYKLKSVLKMFLGNIGLPSNKVAPLTAIILLREHVFDGGYYPKGGMQKFANTLLKNFTGKGGQIIYNANIEKVLIQDHSAKGVSFAQQHFKSQHIVFACDMKRVVYELIGKNNCNKHCVKEIKTNIPSISGFSVYLGLDFKIGSYFKNTKANIWYCKHYDIDKEYQEPTGDNFYTKGTFVFCSSPSLKDSSLSPSGKDSLELMILAPYMSKNYWLKNSEKVKQNILVRASNIIPNLLESKIDIIDFSTPITLEKYTNNYHGALYGWASTPSQIGKGASFAKRLGIKNLSFAGHWAGLLANYGGITSAAYSGRNVAKLVKQKLGKT